MRNINICLNTRTLVSQKPQFGTTALHALPVFSALLPVSIYLRCAVGACGRAGQGEHHSQTFFLHKASTIPALCFLQESMPADEAQRTKQLTIQNN